MTLGSQKVENRALHRKSGVIATNRDLHAEPLFDKAGQVSNLPLPYDPIEAAIEFAPTGTQNLPPADVN